MKRFISSRWGKVLLGGLGALMLGVGYVAVASARTPGGFEEWLGDTVSDLRVTFPSLVDPITSFQDTVHEQGYRLSLWWNGVEESPEPAPETALVALAPASEKEVSRGLKLGAELDPGQVRSDASSRTVASIPPIERAPLRMKLQAVSWQAYSAEGPAWLSMAKVALNPKGAREPALLLKIDMKQARLRWQPGTQNPWPMTKEKERLPDATPKPDRSGRIPAQELQGATLAFGGGFESIHFTNYGGIHRGKVVVPLSKTIQTLVQYSDGSLRMGPWGDPSLPTEGILEARQNLPPLVHAGQIPAKVERLNVGTLGAPRVYDEQGRRVWTDVHTWRSGMGLTPDGDVVYVFGSRLNPRLLAEGLLRAGAAEGMMLDINAAYHCAPSLITPRAGARPAVIGLFPNLYNAGERFLTGSRKDFFYFVTRPGSLQGA